MSKERDATTITGDLYTKNMFEKVSESFMDFDFADNQAEDDVETDYINECTKTETDFENLLKVNRITKDGIIQPNFDLDAFHNMFVFDQCFDANLTESTNDCKSGIPSGIKNNNNNEPFTYPKEENTEKSLQDFEEILRNYGTEMVRIQKRLCDTPQINVIEMPGGGNVAKDTEIMLVEYDSDYERIYNMDTKEIVSNDLTKIQARVTENFNNDIKGLTATDDKVSPIIVLTDSDCEGYHSSDFEFITESEAHLAGLISKDSKSKWKNSKFKLSPTLKDRTRIIITSDDDDNVPSGSNMNNAREFANDMAKYWSRAYNRNLLLEQYNKESQDKRKSPEIPQGSTYLNLFQGIQPTTTVFAENKSVRSPACMKLEGLVYENINMMNCNEDYEESVNIQLLKEAKENAKRILQKYPEENKKKRRQF